MSEPLPVAVSELAAEHIRAVEGWWRANRSKAPNAIRDELERASRLIAIQPEVGTRARNAKLAGVRRVHLVRVRYYLYYRVVDGPRRVELLAFWHESRSSNPPL